MGTLQAALAWARRGFRVFPLQENSREPATDDWREVATSDLTLLSQIWTDPVLKTERNFNIGCVCTDMVVIDIDVKKGKDGYNRYCQLGGTFDTLVVRTTSGGYHCYFMGPDSSNKAIDPNGVDVRSHNGYVVAPGSTIDGNPYVVINDRDMTWVPPTIERLLTPAYRKSEIDMTLTNDSQASVQAAINFLQSAPVAIEGQRGDDTTFVTAARLVREMSLSVPTAYRLLVEHWNPRCVPPWNEAELYQKVENAAAYGSAEYGRLTAEATYGHLDIQPPPSVFQQAPTISYGNAVMPSAIEPRRWVMDRALLEGAVTLLVAAGSAGKSSISLSIAAHLTQGKDFAGFQAKRKCKVVVFNGEDDITEQSRRLLACCITHGFEYDTVKRSIMLLSSEQLAFDLVKKDFSKGIRNDVLVQQIIQLVSDPEVGLLVVDPLVDIHECDEKDNVQMAFVMKTLTHIAKKSGIAVLVLHHTNKVSMSQEDRIGNPDIGRGAGAIVNASRIAFTLLNPSKEDAEEFGMQDSERNLWVRLDDAKMNNSLASKDAIWFKREGVKIVSGDTVGVLKHDRIERGRQHIRNRVADILIATMTANGTGSMQMAQVVAVVKEKEPLWANMTDADIKRKIEGLFSTAIDIRGNVLQVKRDPDSKTNKPILTLG